TTRGRAADSAVARSSGVRANSSGTPARRAVSRMRATKNRSRTTATTREPSPSLVILFADPQPVLVPFGDVAEGPEIRHAVDVDDALEMVGLVLDHPGEEVLRDQVHRVGLAIVALQPHRRDSRHHAAHIGDGETALPA